MRKAIASVVCSGAGFFMSLLFVSSALAQETAQTGAVNYTKAIVIGACVIGAAFAIGVAALGVGIGMGGATGSATQGISRNPEASGKIMLALIVGLAMTESICIYALVIALVTLYANPLLKYVFG